MGCCFFASRGWLKFFVTSCSAPDFVFQCCHLLPPSLHTETLTAHAGPGGAYEDTVLLVLSDHGQTQGGDHGGGTRDETDSVLIAVSLHKLHQATKQVQEATFLPALPLQEHVSARSCSISSPEHSGFEPLLQHLVAAGGYQDPNSPTGLSEQYPQLTVGPWFCNSSMSQIDLTPLVAHLLGVAVPFGNLGKVPPHLFVALAAGKETTNSSTPRTCHDGALEDDGTPAVAWLLDYADALSSNVEQVQQPSDIGSSSVA